METTNDDRNHTEQKYNRFKAGSGVYVCADCGKKTRNTGEGGAEVGMCAKCFMEAEKYNAELNDTEPLG